MRDHGHQPRAAALVVVLGLAVAGCATGTPTGGRSPAAASADNGSSHSGEPVEIDEREWFRDIRLDGWEAQGGDPAVMNAVLHRLKNATGKRENPEWFDTVIAPGAGNWVTEWGAAGRRAVREADAAQARGDTSAVRKRSLEASLYYTLAAYPEHRESAREKAAYRKAKAAYERAAGLTEAGVQRLRIPFEGGVLETYLHLPKGNGPFPVVITSGGIDVARTSHFTLFEKYLAPSGIAMVALDNAGFGDSRAWPADRPDTDRLYSAVVDRLRTHQRIDPERIGAMGASYGGNTVGRLAFTDKRVRAVVSVCGPVHQALDKGPGFIENLPPMTRAALAARYGVPAEDTERLAQIARKASLVNQKLVGTTRTDTPILAINTPDDPLAPVSDIKRLVASSADGELKITGGSGHCPPLEERYAAARSWFERKL
ncbi:alpha/beta fold hydrolase [Streptomyces tubercidicus]|uniref:alpha/beta fold hydrolase n=1 Tax=Streptomyces tubercidicus TaxID=47759 RepID=UPI0034665D96